MESIKFAAQSSQTKYVQSSSSNIQGMNDRLKDYKGLVDEITRYKGGMALMMRLMCRHCTAQSIAGFIMSATFFNDEANSLEACLHRPEHEDLVNFIKQIACAHLGERYSWFGGGYCLKNNHAEALRKICDFGSEEPKDQIEEKITYLMRDILEIEEKICGSSEKTEYELPEGIAEFIALCQASESGIDVIPEQMPKYELKMKLMEMDLSGLNFSKMNLKGMHFWNTNLSGANFSGADLKDVSFLGSDLSNVNLSEVKNWSAATFIHVKSLFGAKSTCSKLQNLLDSEQKKAVRRSKPGALSHIRIGVGELLEAERLELAREQEAERLKLAGKHEAERSQLAREQAGSDDSSCTIS